MSTMFKIYSFLFLFCFFNFRVKKPSTSKNINFQSLVWIKKEAFLSWCVPCPRKHEDFAFLFMIKLSIKSNFWIESIAVLVWFCFFVFFVLFYFFNQRMSALAPNS